MSRLGGRLDKGRQRNPTSGGVSSVERHGQRRSGQPVVLVGGYSKFQNDHLTGLPSYTAGTLLGAVVSALHSCCTETELYT